MSEGVAVIGAGLAGLSAAYHLGGRCRVFEAGDAPGGLLRTREIGGYRFDYTGHLLHLKDDYVRGLVKGLLAGNLLELTRDSAIYSKGVFTGYPFQANTYGLPEEAARECVEGFKRAAGRGAGNAVPTNFRDWIIHHFGEGIARHFMLPYNGKLWQYDLGGMTVDGIAPYVPVPTVEDIERGATAGGARGLGYNPSFFYPERGGIFSLVESLLPHVKDLSLGQRAVELDAEKKAVTFDTGYTAWYDSMVSTMPLPELISIIKDVPADILDAAKGLRYVSVYDVSLGIERGDISPHHWVYFPEPEFPFYRAGFLNNFAPSMAPEGCSSMYVEVSHRPDAAMDEEMLKRDVIDGLSRCGLLKGDEAVPVKDVQDIRYAYVVFDRHRERSLPAIMGYLASKGITSIGRYGAWEYSSMEDAILEGRAAAAALM